MSKRFLTIVSCVAVILLNGIPALHTNKISLGVWNPDAPSPFKIPKGFQDLLKDYRKKWTLLTHLEFSGLHWKKGIVIYINKNYKTFLRNHIGFLKIQEDLLEDDEEEDELFSVYPVGTIVLKENYFLEKGVPKRISTVTVMIKRLAGYDPGGGDWEFLQFNPEGKILVNGNSNNKVVETTCASCHKNIVSRDYIFSTFFKSRPTSIINLQN